MRTIPEIATKVYVDDRVVTTTSNTPEERLAEAHKRSGEVDAALGLERHPDKHQAASSTKAGRKRLKHVADLLLHRCELGVVFWDGNVRGVIALETTRSSV